jgi:transcription initiation factor TFIIIB Brf1 subunit/transcription initiation factor TFIIB
MAKKCIECGGVVVVSPFGEYVCTGCGLVSASALDKDAAFGSLHPSEKSHVSPGKRLHIVDGLGSDIGYKTQHRFRDAQGTVLSYKMQLLFKRLVMVNMKVRTSVREGDFNALRLLNHVTVVLTLNSVVRDRAAYYYQKATGDAEVKNRVITVAACLLIAAREFEGLAPVTLQELAQVFRERGHKVSPRYIVRELPELQRRLGLGVRVRKSEDYVSKIVSDVVAQPEIQRKLREADLEDGEYSASVSSFALSILRALTHRGGRNPYVLAAAAVYAADRQLCAETRGVRPILTEKLVSRAARTPEYSIREHYCRLIKAQVFNGETPKLNNAAKEQDGQESMVQWVNLHE